MKIGFIGVGRMGGAMARAAARAGHEVWAYDPRASATAPLAEAGIHPADSPGTIARECDIAALMVLNAAQAEDALWGDDGFACSPPRCQALAIMSSLDQTAIDAFAGRAASKGFALVDAPVSGGIEGAEAGTLTVLASGAERTLAALAPLFDAIGSQTIVVGARPGMASVVKAANQGIYLATLVASAEMLAGAVRHGVDPEVFVDAISRCGGDSWTLRRRLPLAWRSGYRSGGALEVAEKDITNAAALTEGLADPSLSLIRLTQELVRQSATIHDGGDDLLVVQDLEQRFGVRLSA